MKFAFVSDPIISLSNVLQCCSARPVHCRDSLKTLSETGIIHRAITAVSKSIVNIGRCMVIRIRRLIEYHADRVRWWERKPDGCVFVLMGDQHTDTKIED